MSRRFANLPLDTGIVPAALLSRSNTPVATASLGVFIKAQAKNDLTLTLMEPTDDCIHTPTSTGLVHILEEDIGVGLGTANRVVYSSIGDNGTATGICTVLSGNTDFQMTLHILNAT